MWPAVRMPPRQTESQDFRQQNFGPDAPASRKPLTGRTDALGEAVQALQALEGRGVAGKILVRTAGVATAADRRL